MLYPLAFSVAIVTWFAQTESPSEIIWIDGIKINLTLFDYLSTLDWFCRNKPLSNWVFVTFRPAQVSKSHQIFTFCHLDLDAQIEEFVQKSADGLWCCAGCGHKSKRKSLLKLHIESKHLINSGFQWQCGHCDFLAPNKKSFYNHMDRKHPKPKSNFH